MQVQLLGAIITTTERAALMACPNCGVAQTPLKWADPIECPVCNAAFVFKGDEVTIKAGIHSVPKLEA